MSVEDKQIARLVQRELNRRQTLDVTGVKIAVTRAVCTLSGVIKPSTGQFIRPAEEEKALLETARRIPGLKGMYIEVHWEG